MFTNAVIALPSLAGEPGKIFDFNLTLPIIASEFLLLMVILDKTVFGPVGKALDDRDALIRSQLAAVGDNSTEVANLIAEKEQVISSARAEVAKEVASTKAKIDADIAEAQAKAKADVDKQIAAALAKLEAAKAESAAQVETKAKELSDQIIKKVVEV
jgi:F-type H+-transporting ATPase subunit b